jgi:hypothetical protein
VGGRGVGTQALLPRLRLQADLVGAKLRQKAPPHFLAGEGQLAGHGEGPSPLEERRLPHLFRPSEKAHRIPLGQGGELGGVQRVVGLGQG